MKVRQQHDSERRYSPLEEKEEPDKEDDDDSKNPHTYSNNPPVAAVTPGPARLHMISRENEDPQINYNYKDTRDRRGWKHHGNSHPTSRKSRELKGPKQQSHPSSQSVEPPASATPPASQSATPPTAPVDHITGVSATTRRKFAAVSHCIPCMPRTLYASLLVLN